MLSSELQKALNEIISYEIVLGLSEIENMNLDHSAGLQGFKRLHRYYSRDRIEHVLCLSNHLVEYSGFIPTISVQYSSPVTKPASLRECLNHTITRATEQIDRLKRAAKIAIDEQEDVLMGKLECLVKDESEELIRYRRIWTECEAVGWDMSHVHHKSWWMHEKYKKKEREYQGREY